jgi:hypothetical protein
MSDYSQFALSPIQRPPIELVNAHSDGNAFARFIWYSMYNTMVKAVLSGALTADTYKTMLDITGSGVIGVCGVATVDNTSRAVGLKITIDGTVAFEAVSSATTVVNAGIFGIGGAIITSTSVYGNNISELVVFNTSLKVEISSTLNETDKVRVLYNYKLG